MTRVSIKRDIYLYLFGLVSSLTAIYGLMISLSYYTGFDESAKYDFLYEVKLAEREFLKSNQLPQTQSSTFQVYLDISQVPDKFHEAFDWEGMENDVIYEHYTPPTDGNAGEYLYVISHYIASKDITLYVASLYDEAIYLELLELIPPESASHFNTAFVLIGGLLLLVFLIIRLLIHRLTKPILVLSNWSETLDLNNAEKLKHFRYREVDLLASQLVKSVKSQRDAIEREEFFLRAASHELRTPVSIISASGDMLDRLSESMPKGAQRAAARIRRSAAIMQNLITTLLWMSRNTQPDLKPSTIDLNALGQEIIESHRYLIEGRNIAVQLRVEPNTPSATLPTVLLQIVLTNLIRNAFQHTAEGTIDISLSSTRVQVTNPLEGHQGDKPISAEASFGIGLTLVEKVCLNQGWAFSHRHQNGDFFASVCFDERPDDGD